MVTTSYRLKIGQTIRIGQIEAILTSVNGDEIKLSFDLDSIRHKPVTVSNETSLKAISIVNGLERLEELDKF